MAKVKALHMFAHSKAVAGLRQAGEVFECSVEEIERLNAIHDFDLVEIMEPADETQEPADDGADDVPKRKGRKSTKAADN